MSSAPRRHQRRAAGEDDPLPVALRGGGLPAVPPGCIPHLHLIQEQQRSWEVGEMLFSPSSLLLLCTVTLTFQPFMFSGVSYLFGIFFMDLEWDGRKVLGKESPVFPND